MKVGLGEIVEWAGKNGCAVPAFNVYNMETVMGVFLAAKETNAPIIMQVYSRLFDEEFGRFVIACAKEAADALSTPCAIHLDHGAGMTEVQRALRYGTTSIMIDASSHTIEENIATTKSVVNLCGMIDVQVEGELGHIGTTKEPIPTDFTRADEAERFVKETGVAALAVLVGNAHGRYKQAPHLNIQRIHEISEATGTPLVLHGGTGIPDDQIKAAIANGIRKVNFGTDVCYSFLDAVRSVPASIIGIDTFMTEPVQAVKRYALSKIHLLEDRP